MPYTAKLNNWLCNCGEFQIICLLRFHIIVCSFSHLQLIIFIDLKQNLQLEFYPIRKEDYISCYLTCNVKIKKINYNNKINQPIQDKSKKYFYFRKQGHTKKICNIYLLTLLKFFYLIMSSLEL